MSTSPGYFQLGGDTICYGCHASPSNGSRINGLHDVLPEVSIEKWASVLPFDPDEVIENLRFERYRNGSTALQANFLHHAYYTLRPLLPVWFRKHLQTWHLSDWRDAAFPQWPFDCTVEKLLDQLLAFALQAQGMTSMPFIWFWPDRLASCAIITHDVETSSGLDFCESLMDIEDSFGLKSSFQIVPEKRYKVTDRFLNGIRDRGFEINIHDLNHDGRLYSDRSEFLGRAKKINEYARRYGALGFRSGALYRNLDWYGAFEFSYDMSVPSVGHLEAQGGGCCTVRPYFVDKLVELPVTTTQDYSLFHIIGENSINLWKRQTRAIMQTHGLVSFIIHPDYLLKKKTQDIYKSLLQYLVQLQAEERLWIARPGDVACWWRQRDAMVLTRDQANEWQVSGIRKEKACVAQANINESGIAYTM
jgi:hypothetical protein